MTNSPSCDVSDEHLIQEYMNSGDEAHFQQLYDRHYQGLVAFIFNRYLRDHEMAEEVAQGAFFRVHQRAGDYVPDKSFAKWLYWLGGNGAINHARDLRRLKRGGGQQTFSLNRRVTSEDHDRRDDDDCKDNDDHRDVEEAEPGTLEIFVEDEMLEFQPAAIYEALTALGEAHQQILTRIFYAKKSERDVAAEMNTTRHQVRQLLGEALAALKANLMAQS